MSSRTGSQVRRYACRGMLVLLSVTNALVNLATHVIRDIGLAGVFALTLASGVIGFPGTEPTMLFAGFNVYDHHFTLVGIIVAGVVGDVLGASIAYAIGYFGNRELFERQGRKLHMSTKRLDRTHRWFERYGAPAVFLSRLIPFVRAAFPYAAGVAEMPFARFISLATMGSIVWISFLGVLGREVGSNWQHWRHNLEYVDYIGAAVVAAAILYLIWRGVRSRRAVPDAPVQATQATRPARVSNRANASEGDRAPDVVS